MTFSNSSVGTDSDEVNATHTFVNKTPRDNKTGPAKPVTLTGIQPSSGSLHLGNYLGALRNLVRLQETSTTYFMIANLHSMTSQKSPDELRESVITVTAQCVAAGLCPEKSVLFLQSDVWQHNQLAWVLSNICGFGEAARMTQFKDKSAVQNNASVGLFTYPILMAADILLYNADLVPVGADQKQHLELTRELAGRFNAKYGDVFTIPEPFECSTRLYDLQNPVVKMSKSSPSENGVIFLLDDPDKIVKKLMRSVTDSDNSVSYDREAKPGISNLLTIYSSLSECTVEQAANLYSGRPYSALKKDLADMLVDVCGGIREKTDELLGDRGYLRSMLNIGAEKARQVAQSTIGRVYEKLGIY